MCFGLGGGPESLSPWEEMLVMVWGEVQRLCTAGWEVHEEALALGSGNPGSEPLLWGD